MGDCNIYVNCDNKNEHIESLIKRVIAEQEDGTLAVRTCCVEGACTPYVECDKRESVESLFKKLIVENEDGSLAVRVNCCSSTPVPPVLGALELTFDDIANADLLIGGSSSDYTVWNTFFGFDTDPTLYTTQFTSVTVAGNVVKLYGGSGITIKNYSFADANAGAQKDAILQIVDNASCVVGLECESGPYTPFVSDDYGYCTALTYVKFPVLTACGISAFYGCTGLISPDYLALTTCGDGAFGGCTGLISPDFSALTTCGNGAFYGCTSYTTINLPSCTALGPTTGNNNVFYGIINQTITLTVPTALMNAQGVGIPDGDIQYLTAPAQGNTVTIIQV
jgi:hypothetical protein